MTSPEAEHGSPAQHIPINPAAHTPEITVLGTTRESTAGSNPRVYLASTSPRRAKIISQTSLRHDVGPSGVDDGMLEPGRGAPESWVMALAYLKASAGARHVNACDQDYDVVIGADTVCVVGDEVVGQPDSLDHARSMIRGMMGIEHRVLTGIALLCPVSGKRVLYNDSATVVLGGLADDILEAYLDSGAWRGKAGGYNLIDRIEDGWPIEFDGEAECIMGLPVAQLEDRVRSFVATLV